MKKKIIVIISIVLAVAVAVLAVLLFKPAKPIEYNNRKLTFTETVYSKNADFTSGESFVVRDNVFMDCVAGAAATNDLGWTDIGALYETDFDNEKFDTLITTENWANGYSADIIKAKTVKVLRADDLNDGDSGSSKEKNESYRLLIVTDSQIFVCRVADVAQNGIPEVLSIYKLTSEVL